VINESQFIYAVYWVSIHTGKSLSSMLPSATVMLASSVSPLAHTDQLPDYQMTADTHQYDEQQNGACSLIHTAYIPYLSYCALS